MQADPDDDFDDFDDELDGDLDDELDDFDDESDDDSESSYGNANPPTESAPYSNDDDYRVTLADMGLDYDGFSWDDVGGD